MEIGWDVLSMSMLALVSMKETLSFPLAWPS